MAADWRLRQGASLGAVPSSPDAWAIAPSRPVARVWCEVRQRMTGAEELGRQVAGPPMVRESETRAVMSGNARITSSRTRKPGSRATGGLSRR